MKNEKGVMASWLVGLTLDQVIQVQALASTSCCVLGT